MSAAQHPHSPRADAQRNRARLVAAATEAFSTAEGPVSMDSIARRAGVGSGTLYRHFATREDLIEEVYRDQIDRLRSGAEELLAAHPPVQALRQWTELLADWAATKHGMHDALAAFMASGRITGSQMRAELVSILRDFLDAGARAGTLKDDVDAADLGALLAGALVVAGDPAERAQLRRMFALIIDGVVADGGR
ncbi:TetR/AcrR family transcriptional regulator [Microbacterium sp. ARD32]|uniref:TetR/AcrR family transcriptional regulator n=1 Tax=Microbacterium sp. ARD32 TaxID=2962577 RepID=UPI00288149ED|nr:TetR/AcrR family transcriptional regulator [Microbacterium sp. ARD32]MDT0157802.1 TetR/AcrR family transcriptional regulator [Microbacterium sp. ARD32]